MSGGLSLWLLAGAFVRPARDARVTLIARLVPLVIALGAIGAHAAAQSASNDSIRDALGQQRSSLGMRVEMGWSGQGRLGAWMPIRITLFGGESPVTGELRVTLESYGGPTRVVTPFTTTPNRATPVDLAAPTTGWLRRIIVEARDARGRLLDRRRFPSETQELPSLLGRMDPLIAVVGRCSLRGIDPPALQPDQTGPTDEDDGSEAPPDSIDWEKASIVSVEPASLPTRESSYEPLSALVLAGEAISRISEPAAAAIRNWLRAGGHLILVLDRAGSVHERFAPPSLVRAEAARRLGGEGVTVRPLRRSPNASLWSETMPADNGRDAVAIAGPVEFGWVSMLGADPARLDPDAEVGDAWRSLLGGGLLESQFVAANEDPGPDIWSPGVRYSRSYRNAINWVAGQMDVRPFPIWILIAFLGSLALLIGPIDWFGLRAMRKRHRSWMTAIAWIVLFSAIGYLGPRYIRSGDTKMIRVTSADIISGAETMRTASVTGVFLGESMPLNMVARDADAPRWWRPIDEAGDGVGSIIGAAPTLVQGPSRSGVQLAPTPGRLWTFRTLFDAAEPPRRFDASVTRVDTDGSLRYELEIDGLRGAEPAYAALFTIDGVRPLRESTGSPDLFIAEGEPTGEDSRLAELWRETNVSPGYWSSYENERNRLEPRDALGFPGASDRTLLFKHGVEAGTHAVVAFTLDEPTPDVALRRAEDVSQRTVVRILAPIRVVDRTHPDSRESDA